MTRRFGQPVTVQYYKYPDTPHWRHSMWYLGDDDHGTWLGGPTGTTVQRGAEPAIAWARPFVQLVPPSGWWTLLGNDETSKYAIYVDITTQAVWDGDVVEMVDIDLDVIRTWDGETRLLDEDEFEDHRITLNYPAWLIDGARTSAAEIMLAAERRAEPFGAASAAWLARIPELEAHLAG